MGTAYVTASVLQSIGALFVAIWLVRSLLAPSALGRHKASANLS